MKKSINRNYFWTRLFVTQLKEYGVKHVCISPGSRNTPLTLAFAENKWFKKSIHVDERSNGFFALGLSKVTRKPTVIVTTSGTAVAELYPAIIEAYNERIPLIICTADRPDYLRETGANQTINQDNIYKNHIRSFIDFGLPDLSLKKLEVYLDNIRETINIASITNPGPVHLNFPFKKPLEPSVFTEKVNFSLNDFDLRKKIPKKEVISIISITKISDQISNSKRPVIHLGGGNFDKLFYKKLLEYSNKNNIPVLIDGTSSLRFIKGKNNNLCVNHSIYLNKSSLQPDLIINFGNAATSQSILNYLERTDTKKILINEFGDIKDPSRIKGELFKLNENVLLDSLLKYKSDYSKYNSWMKYLNNLEQLCEKNKVKITHAEFGIEPRLVNEILDLVPNNSNIFISNSMPVRDFDTFASKIKKNFNIYCNRGASGIDGIISTASGIASESKNDTFLIVGDLAFYHNLTALSTLNELNIPLKIVLINNNGGGIFNMLPISSEKKYFEKYFITPQKNNYKLLIKAFGGTYFTAKSWKTFKQKMNEFIILKKFSVIEIFTDSKRSIELRKQYLGEVEKWIKRLDAPINK